jgi:predicted DNA-binding protein
MLDLDNKKKKPQTSSSKQYGTRVTKETALTLEELAKEQGKTVSLQINELVTESLKEYRQRRDMARVSLELGKLSDKSLENVFNLFNGLTLSGEMDQTDFLEFFRQLLKEKVERLNKKGAKN